jgi:hypothetical protein
VKGDGLHAGGGRAGAGRDGARSRNSVQEMRSCAKVEALFAMYYPVCKKRSVSLK